MAEASGSVTFEVILRPKGHPDRESVVGEVVVPVHATPTGSEVREVDIDSALILLGSGGQRSRRGRRKAARAGRR